MSRHVVKDFPRNARERVVLAWDAYEGHDYLDLRIWFEDGPELKPSKKGLTLRGDQIDDMIDALQAAKAAGQQLGIVS